MTDVSPSQARREFLKGTIVGIAAGTTLATSYFKRPDVIETEHAVFHVRFETHLTRELPKKGEFDAVFTEAWHSGENSKFRRKDASLLCQGTPTYLIDGVAVTNLEKLLTPQVTLGMAAETLAGLYVLSNLRSDDTSKIGRKEAFIGMGKKLLGIHLITPTIAGVIRFIAGDFSPAMRSMALASEAVSASHPELFYHVIKERNLIMAAKSIALAEIVHSELGRKPKICIMIGKAHTGIIPQLSLPNREVITDLQRELGEKLKDQDIIFKITGEGGLDNKPSSHQMQIYTGVLGTKEIGLKSFEFADER